MVRENHRRQKHERKNVQNVMRQPVTTIGTAAPTMHTGTSTNTNGPTISAIPFGRNYFYSLTAFTPPCNHSLVATSPNQTTSTDDDYGDNDDDTSDHDETDTSGTIHLPLPWNQVNSHHHQQLLMPLSATCSSQSTTVVSPKDGKVYQTGTMHGTVYTNWKHIIIPLPLKCVQVSAGRHYCLARMEGGNAVMSWGAGHFGQLGVVVSTNHTTKKTCRNTGSNDHGQNDSCSDDDDDDDDDEDSTGSNGKDTRNSPSVKCISFTSRPVLIERLLPAVTGSPIQSIAAGDWHALALTESGHVWSWGSNRSLQCGIPLRKDSTSSSSSTMGSLALPLPIPGLPPMKQIAAGRAHSCALTAGSGKVYCWGSSHTGQCGTGTTLRRSIKGILPTPVQGLPSSLEMIQIDAAGNHCISLSKAGRVFTWGDGREGQLGFSISTSTSRCISLQDLFSNKPRLVADLDFVAVAASRTLRTAEQRHTIPTDNVSPTYSAAPVLPAAHLLARTPKITSVYASDNGSAAISSSGHVYCWGSNDVGQLGIPKPTNILHEDSSDASLPDHHHVKTQEKSAASPNNTDHPVVTRLQHIQTFDSNHNVLLPIRLDKIDKTFIRSLVMGPNHMFCFGAERNDEEQAMIVGQTLHEAQQNQVNSHQIQNVSYKVNTTSILHRPIATGIYVNSATTIDNDRYHQCNKDSQQSMSTVDVEERPLISDGNSMSNTNDSTRNNTGSIAISLSRTTSSSSSPVTTTTTATNLLTNHIVVKPFETFGPVSVSDTTIHTASATPKANTTNTPVRSTTATSPTNKELQLLPQNKNNDALHNSPIEKRDGAVRRRFSFGLFTRRRSLSSTSLMRPRRNRNSNTNANRDIIIINDTKNEQHEPSTGTV